MTYRLVPYQREHLPVVQPWFENAEVDLRLGGPDWPAREFELQEKLPGTQYRGALTLRMRAWVMVADDDVPLALLTASEYDRWTTCGPGTGDETISVVSVEDVTSAGFAVVVDPSNWGRGLGRTAVELLVAHPDLADVRLFGAGIDADNLASQRCMTSAGFRPDVAEPDWENTVYYLRRR